MCIIADAYMTKGNVYDSKSYIPRMKYIKETFGFDIKKCGVDSGYIVAQHFIGDRNYSILYFF